MLAIRVRDGYNGFVARHDIAWELAFGFLAIGFVALGFLIDEAPAGSRQSFESVEWAITGVFAFEFASRLAAAHDRVRYVRGHWIDLVALVPPVRPSLTLSRARSRLNPDELSRNSPVRSLPPRATSRGTPTLRRRSTLRGPLP